MKYDEYKKMKNFAVIIDQDKTNKTTEDNLETRINPKLSKTRFVKSYIRKFADDGIGKNAVMVLPHALTAVTGNPVFELDSGVMNRLLYDKVKNGIVKPTFSPIYNNTINPLLGKGSDMYSGVSKFSKNYVFKVDPNKYYIIDYVDDLHINVYGNGSGYPTRYDAKRAFEDSDYMKRKHGVIRINKGSTLIEYYPQKFRRVADG